MNDGSKQVHGVSRALWAAIASSAVLAACYSASGDTTTLGVGGSGGGAGGSSGSSGSGGSAGDTGANGCLPANIEQFLQANCLSCHGNPPTAGAPMPLVTLADLLAPDPNDPSISTAQGSLSRMQKGEMPPGGGLSPADVTTFMLWVDAGAQGVSCGGGTGGSAGGGTGGSGGDPYNTPTVCSSGRNWSGGTGSSMAPGEACNNCHNFGFAGTVYKTAHEPNDCNGDPSIQVVITPPSGTPQTVTTNSAGNFRGNLFTPGSHVKVVSGGKERAMSSSPPTGDCNSCHTEKGSQSAPGRIMAP